MGFIYQKRDLHKGFPVYGRPNTITTTYSVVVSRSSCSGESAGGSGFRDGRLQPGSSGQRRGRGAAGAYAHHQALVLGSVSGVCAGEEVRRVVGQRRLVLRTGEVSAVVRDGGDLAQGALLLSVLCDKLDGALVTVQRGWRFEALLRRHAKTGRS